MLSDPMIEEEPGVYRFRWEQEHISVLVRGVHGQNSKTGAELVFETDLDGESKHLHQCDLNLTGTRPRTDLAKHMSGLVKNRNMGIDWTVLLERLVVTVLERSRRGSPVILLDSSTRPVQPQFAVWPILPEKELTLLFGLGGAGKSYLALLLGIAMQAEWDSRELGFEVQQERRRVLYLDWETSPEEINWRLWKLCKGLGIEPVQMRYRRCFRPLADDIDALQSMIAAENIGSIIVDSIGWAAGGDINATEPAIRMVQAIRQLDTTTLGITHTAKNAEADKRTAYGNAYYMNGARSAWEVDKIQDVDADQIDVGMFHRKANGSKYFDARGFRLSFDEESESVTVSKIDLIRTPGLEERMPMPRRIVAALKGQGRKTAAELVDQLNGNKKSMTTTLWRMVKAGQIVALANGYYGAAN